MDSDALTVVLSPRSHGRGPFDVSLRYAEKDGELVCIELVVTATGDEPVSTTVIRGLNPQALIRLGRSKLKREQVHVDVSEDAAARADEIMASRPGRRPKWTGGDLARVAAAYLEAMRAGRKAVREVAKTLGVSEAGAIALIRRARGFGFLDPTTRGKRSGHSVNVRAHTVGAKAAIPAVRPTIGAQAP